MSYSTPNAGITRLHGGSFAQTLHGGYQLRWFEIADSSYDSTPGTVNSKFELAVRAIETVATVVVLGAPGTQGFLVGVDGATFSGRNDSTGYRTGGAGETEAEILKSVIEAAAGGTATVTEKYIGGGTGKVFTTV